MPASKSAGKTEGRVAGRIARKTSFLSYLSY
jgi:hypothetical protein